MTKAKLFDPGDVISLPTHMFRGFENITELNESNPNGFGFMFAVLGGNDSGGGVLWAPQVIEAAQAHGLVLLENGLLIDTHNGESIPDGIAPRKPLEGADWKHLTKTILTQISFSRRNLPLTALSLALQTKQQSVKCLI